MTAKVTEERTKVFLMLNPDLRRDVKVKATKLDMDFREAVTEALQDWLKKPQHNSH